MNYWEECISVAFDEAGITATNEQIKRVANDVEIAHDNHDIYRGYPTTGTSPLDQENKQIKRMLEEEREKVICKECNGTGRDISHGPSFTVESSCWKCNGDGRHKP